MFKIHHRIWIVNGGNQQSFCIHWSRWINYFQTRAMDKPGLIALRMEGTRSNPASGRHPDNHISILPPPVVDFCQVVDDLVKTHRDKISELHFHYAFK